MDFFVPFDQLGQPVPGPWKNANPNAGQRGSIVNALVFPAVQNELLAIQDEAGLTRDVNNNAQTLQALRSGKLNTFTDIGTADAIVVQPLSAFISVFLGTEISFLKGPGDNATTTPTLTIGAGSLHAGSAITHPIVKQDGTAVAAGDLKGSSLIKVKYDGLNSFRVITMTRSEIVSSTVLTNIIQQIPAVAPVANVFFGAGAGSYTVPAGVYNIDVELIGGGAGGSSGTASGTYSAGGGGGSGGSARGALAVTPGQVINYVVGAGGAGAPSVNGYGSSGTSTTFGTTLTAPGAQVGTTGGYNVGSGQLGGAVGIGGYLNLKGSAGGDGAPSGAIGGNGGGTAYGTGGRAGIPNGESASAYGSGGGGAYNGGTGTTPGAGGRGADGVIIIRHN